MSRRNLLKTALTLPLLSLMLSPTRSLLAATRRLLRKVRPGDLDWPTPANGRRSGLLPLFSPPLGSEAWTPMDSNLLPMVKSKCETRFQLTDTTRAGMQLESLLWFAASNTRSNRLIAAGAAGMSR